MTLAATRVSRHIDSHVLLDDVSVEVEPGKILAIIGPNGSGKSTLLNALSGRMAVDGGVIELDGDDIKDLSVNAQARKRAYMSQSSAVTFEFTLLDIVMMGRHPHIGHRAEGPADREIARKSLVKTDMLAFAKRLFMTLSGGEQARGHFARCLAQDPVYLLLDEPTASLDPLHKIGLLNAARELADKGVGIAIVLHDLNLVARYADRVAVLREGRVVHFGSAEKVMTSETLADVFGLPFSSHVDAKTERPVFSYG